MIEFTENKADIIKCWHEAFGDSSEDIIFFIDNANARCLAYYVDGEIASMLYLVDSSLGKYIYVACTLKKYRANGLMTRLLDYCKENFNKLCLIPANSDLIDYYKRRGFVIEYPVNQLLFNQIDEINEFLFEGCELEQPVVLAYEREV